LDTDTKEVLLGSEEADHKRVRGVDRPANGSLVHTSLAVRTGTIEDLRVDYIIVEGSRCVCVEKEASHEKAFLVVLLLKGIFVVD
jgi:hypothetical protein